MSTLVPLYGLHLSADGRLKQRSDGSRVDIDIARAARVERVKVLSTASDEDIELLRRAGYEPALILCRLFVQFAGRVVSAQDFVRWTIDDAMRHYAKGVRLFEVHNEPNLRTEGMFVSWSNGSQFAQWFAEVVDLLRLALPDARFGFPGLSPNGAPFADRYDDLVFAREAVGAIKRADFHCSHCYFASPAEFTDIRAGAAWRVITDRGDGKPHYITEVSNNVQGIDKREKARQLIQWASQLPTDRGIVAFFIFIATASSQFDSEVLDGSPMPEIIGARPTEPVPAAPAVEFHKVVRGETLLGIARRYGITLAEVLRLNPLILNASLIYPGQAIRVKAEAQPVPVEPVPAQPSVYRELTREQWGARADSGIDGTGFTGWDIATRRLGVQVPPADRLAVIIHHTVGIDRDSGPTPTPNEWESVYEVAANMRLLQTVRAADLGPDVPYNFVVYPMADGSTIIAEGRGAQRSGSHTSVRSFNRVAIAYAFAGNYEAYPLPRNIDSVLAAVAEHIAMLRLAGLKNLGTLRPTGRAVFAHRDVWVNDKGQPYTACPGKLLYSRLDAIRI